MSLQVKTSMLDSKNGVEIEHIEVAIKIPLLLVHPAHTPSDCSTTDGLAPASMPVTPIDSPLVSPLSVQATSLPHQTLKLPQVDFVPIHLETPPTPLHSPRFAAPPPSPAILNNLTVTELAWLNELSTRLETVSIEAQVRHWQDAFEPQDGDDVRRTLFSRF